MKEVAGALQAECVSKWSANAPRQRLNAVREFSRSGLHSAGGFIMGSSDQEIVEIPLLALALSV